ncbi:recombinase family protein [Neobacillus sp. KR4-4]|uniref:recombinase family protein n=1 Tax=Neobacillus sp. KR4-4 TaxID=3344872 RepID=UPI0035C9CF6E
MTIYGYGRVSSKLQSEIRQIKSLIEYGVQEENIFIDKLSGKNFDRPEYQKLKSILKESDCVVFHELDRMGRSYDAGMQELYWFQKNKIKLIFLDYLWMNQMTESDDVIVRANGYNMLAMYLAIAETERLKLLKRQKEGIAISKANNPQKYNGRKRAYNKDQVQDAIEKYHTGKFTVKQALAASKMSRSTFYRRLREYQAKQDGLGAAE